MEKVSAPPSSRPKLSLSLKGQFAALEREEVNQYSLVKAPKRMEQSNNWAASNFEQWRRDYNRKNPSSELRGYMLESMDCQELDEVLSTLIPYLLKKFVIQIFIREKNIHSSVF